MTDPRTQAALYESEAALRLVDQELETLGALPQEAAEPGDLTGLLERANGHVLAMLERVQDPHTAIEPAAVVAELEQRLRDVARLLEAGLASAAEPAE